MKAFLARRWFLLALAIMMAAGFCGAGSPQMAPLVRLAESMAVRYGVVAIVLFLMALPLEARAMWRTLRRPGPPLLGVAMNSVALPLLAWLLVATVGHLLLSRDMALGLLTAAATPCTLASAAVWTRRAGGNDAISIMVTVITNASCFLVTPFWLWQMTGESAQIDAPQMILKLALFVVLPMVLAQVTRFARVIGRWATQHTVALGVTAQVGVLIMIFADVHGAGVQHRTDGGFPREPAAGGHRDCRSHTKLTAFLNGRENRRSGTSGCVRSRRGEKAAWCFRPL
jgi:sodium/bile acid cotransporter 7